MGRSFFFTQKRNLPNICKRSRSKVILGMFMAGGNWIRDPLIVDTEDSKTMLPFEIHVKHSNQKRWTLHRERQWILYFHAGRAKSCKKDVIDRCAPSGECPQATISRTIFRRRRSLRSKSSVGDFFYRYRSALRMKFCPETRFSKNFEIHGCSETQKWAFAVLQEGIIDDYWNTDGDESLSELRIGVTRFKLLNKYTRRTWLNRNRSQQDQETLSQTNDHVCQMIRVTANVFKNKRRRDALQGHRTSHLQRFNPGATPRKWLFPRWKRTDLNSWFSRNDLQHESSNRKGSGWHKCRNTHKDHIADGGNVSMSQSHVVHAWFREYGVRGCLRGCFVHKWFSSSSIPFATRRSACWAWPSVACCDAKKEISLGLATLPNEREMWVLPLLQKGPDSQDKSTKESPDADAHLFHASAFELNIGRRLRHTESGSWNHCSFTRTDGPVCPTPWWLAFHCQQVDHWYNTSCLCTRLR